MRKTRKNSHRNFHLCTHYISLSNLPAITRYPYTENFFRSYVTFTSLEEEMKTKEIANGIGVEVHWVMVGDSHIRYIFESLLRRFEASKLEYRLSSFPKVS